MRALDATSDLSELLRLAHSAIHRVQVESHGEAYHLAARLSRHMHYLRKVAELLRHELVRSEGQAAADPSLPSQRVPIRVRALALRPGDEL